MTGDRRIVANTWLVATKLNIEVDRDLVTRVMREFDLVSAAEAVDFALREVRVPRSPGSSWTAWKAWAGTAI
jgi:Arc/MetJ family transcription regulator